MIRPLFKAIEPFMDAKNGFGYQGVVMYDESTDKVQCHICGKWFTSVGHHVAAFHKIHHEDYRDAYGLPIHGNLCGKKMSETHSALADTPIFKQNLKKGRDKLAHTSKEKRRAQFRKCVRRSKLSRNRMYFKNMNGLCDLQMRARFEVVQKIVGRSPSEGELIKYDSALYQRLAKCGFNKWKEHNGYETRGRAPEIQFGNLDLISHLRRYYAETGMIPTKTIFNKPPAGYPSVAPFIREFGSWSNALSQAGL